MEKEKYSLWKEDLSEAEIIIWKTAVERENDNDLDSAIEIHKKLLDKKPNSTLLNISLGSLYEKYFDTMCDHNKMLLAERHFKKAVESAPKSGLASCMYFHCLWDLDKREGAVKEMRRFKVVGDPEDYSEVLEDYGEEIGEIEKSIDSTSINKVT